MKAAVIHQLGTVPRAENFQDPIAQADQLLMNVKAASVKNLDKMRASGKHYASYTELPAIVGIDGAGELEDGTRIYAQGMTGMIAEKALVNKNRYVVLPDNLDFATAAALPNAVLGSALALLYRGQMKAGHTVLINGATGVTGQVAVQLAKFYGASKIIATGRNEASLAKLVELGADTTISLKQDDEAFTKTLRQIHAETPVDIVIDYLWEHPIELIIQVMKGSGHNPFTHPVRMVTVGSMAGENIQLASGTLRSSAIEIVGSGLGSISPQGMQDFSSKILPEMFALAASGKLTIDTVTAPLDEIHEVWEKEIGAGKRLVIEI